MLPRVKTALANERNFNLNLDCSAGISTTPVGSKNPIPGTPCDDDLEGLDQLYFKNDRIYKHRLLRINYTTYDVRRADHVINPRTSHSYIMVLSNNDSQSQASQSKDPFWYAQVLGIYHANMIYGGPGMKDYRPRTFQFLWVRWFQNVDGIQWDNQRLQRIVFPPTASEDAFGFLDPADILRACHILPLFSLGRVHLDGVGLSKLANDAQDWRMYYVNRFVILLFKSNLSSC